MVNKQPLNATFLKVIILLVTLLSPQINASSLETNRVKQSVVQVAVTDLPHSLSPYAMTGVLVAQYSHLFFDPLVRWGKDRKIEYRLVEKIQPLENSTIRFNLKKNIYFHSGNRLTSKDVIWSFDAALNNKYLHRQFQHRVKFVRVNDYQFDIQTKLTQPQLLDYLSNLFILDSTYYKNNEIKHNETQPALSAPIVTLPLSGTGPYRLASFYPEINLRIEANLSYWGDQPAIKYMNFVKVNSKDSRLYALLADDIDISEAIPSKNVNSVHLLDTKQIYQTNLENGLFLIVNEKKNPLFERESIRNAIHLTINQKGMLTHILNGAGTIGRTLKISTDVVKPPAYNAKRSKYLFQKIEMPEQLSLLVMEDENAQTEEVIIALENMFKKVGIRLEITEINDAKQWHELYPDYDLLLSAWHSPLINTDNLHQDIFSNSFLANYIQVLFRQQNKVLTMNEKKLLFQQYQLTDRIIPLFSKNSIWATDKQFDLENVFSVNGIAYWHLLTISDVKY